MTTTGPWKVRLSAAARSDFSQILRWTRERFGDAQARVYSETLTRAVSALREGTSTIGAKSRADIMPSLFSLHVTRKDRKGRHLVLFRIANEEQGEVIEVVRLLHDSMDLRSHVGDAKARGKR